MFLMALQQQTTLTYNPEKPPNFQALSPHNRKLKMIDQIIKLTEVSFF